MPAGQFIYTLRGSYTAGAAAGASGFDYLAVRCAVNQRLAIIGLTMGNQSATSAQGVAWQQLTMQTLPTASGFVAKAVDTGNSRASLTLCSTTCTAVGSGTIGTLEEFAFDIVGSYTKWYPPGKELWIDGATAASVGTIYGVRKVVGADASIWSITSYWAE